MREAKKRYVRVGDSCVDAVQQLGSEVRAHGACVMRAGRDSERRVQPRQTDSVDQFVAREARGYKAEGFSRQRVLCQ